MSKRKWLVAAGGLVTAAVAPVVATAPRAVPSQPDGVVTLDDAVLACRSCGLQGWDLVAYATDLVNKKFTWYSVRHLWESPRIAFENSRGFSDQYNLALAQILTQLGFDVTAVHAARVRQLCGLDERPWWHAGRTWLRVSYDGHQLDVSAGESENKPGDLCFVPESEVRTIHPWTPLNIRLAMAPVVVAEIWGAWLQHTFVPRWLYCEFDRGAAGSTA